MTLKLSTLACRLLGAGLLAGGFAQAQTAAPFNALPGRPSSMGWQVCHALKNDPTVQLACFQQWADSQSSVGAPTATTAPANPATGQPQAQVLLLPALNTDAPDGKPIGCKNNNYSELSKFWELQRGTDCDTFAIRGYRPLSLAVIASDSVNGQTTPACAITCSFSAATATACWTTTENAMC